MQVHFKKRKGLTVEEIREIARIKQEKLYKQYSKSFRNYVRHFTDYSPSTIYAYMRLYRVFGDSLAEIGFFRANVLYYAKKTSSDWIQKAKDLSYKEFISLIMNGS